MQPTNFGLANIAVLENQPTEILRSAARLVAGRDPRSWRHRWPRGQQPDTAQRQLLQPVRGVEPAHEADHCDLRYAQLQRVPTEFFDVIEWWIADDDSSWRDGAAPCQEVALVETIAELVPPAINDVAAAHGVTQTDGFV